ELAHHRGAAVRLAQAVEPLRADQRQGRGGALARAGAEEAQGALVEHLQLLPGVTENGPPQVGGVPGPEPAREECLEQPAAQPGPRIVEQWACVAVRQ